MGPLLGLSIAGATSRLTTTAHARPLAPCTGCRVDTNHDLLTMEERRENAAILARIAKTRPLTTAEHLLLRALFTITDMEGKAGPKPRACTCPTHPSGVGLTSLTCPSHGTDA